VAVDLNEPWPVPLDDRKGRLLGFLEILVGDVSQRNIGWYRRAAVDFKIQCILAFQRVSKLCQFPSSLKKTERVFIYLLCCGGA
jgi:hypothetical protein